MPDSAFASFEQKWLGEFPENVMISVFLPKLQRSRANAFGSLIHELTQTALYRSDAQIALTKLAWWRQELIDAHAGHPRHPITRILFADAQMRASEASLWSGLVNAALAQCDYQVQSDLATVLGRFRPWHAAVARAEATVFSIEPADFDHNAAVWTISFLLRDLARIPARAEAGKLEHAVLPLDLLARHGLSRASLYSPGTSRNAFVGDYLGALLDKLDECLDAAAALSLPRRVRTALDRRLILRARRAFDPLAWLATHQQPDYGRSLWICWREARHSRVG